jgi:hypothetical protein
VKRFRDLQVSIRFMMNNGRKVIKPSLQNLVRVRFPLKALFPNRRQRPFFPRAECAFVKGKNHLAQIPRHDGA